MNYSCAFRMGRSDLPKDSAGYKELGKIDKDVYRIAETKIGIEPELLEKPNLGNE